MSDYSGKIAFITGGARGFGKAFGLEIGSTGTVVLADIDGHAAEQTARALTESGCQAVGLECDVADAEHVERAHGAAPPEGSCKCCRPSANWQSETDFQTACC